MYELHTLKTIPYGSYVMWPRIIWHDEEIGIPIIESKRYYEIYLYSELWFSFDDKTLSTFFTVSIQI